MIPIASLTQDIHVSIGGAAFMISGAIFMSVETLLQEKKKTAQKEKEVNN